MHHGAPTALEIDEYLHEFMTYQVYSHTTSKGRDQKDTDAFIMFIEEID